MDWNRLDRQQSQQVLEHIANAADPGLFTGNFNEASFKPLPFYQDYMVYRITNYSTLPNFSLDFLSDGESFFLLDGSPSPIEIVNTRASLYLTERNVIDYVDFYLSNISGEDGDIYLIRNIENLPFLDSLSLDQQVELKNKSAVPEVAIDDTHGHFIVLGDLFYGGTLLKAAVVVHQDGKVDIQPREMIMASSPYMGGAA